MKVRALLPVFVLVLAALACNFPSNAPVTETPTLSLLLSPTATLSLPTAAPTFTLAPTNTLLPPPTSTPSFPAVSPIGVNVNCRLGPGTAWVPISALLVGQTGQIVGKTADSTWWLINDPISAGRRCWVAGSVVTAGGNLTSVPVVEGPAASVTNTTISTDPRVVSVPGCSGTAPLIEITGAIETNGPTNVTWRFETQQGGAMPTQTTFFETHGERVFSVDYTPPIAAGTYWVRLVVTAPNVMQAEGSYRIDCP